VVRDADKLWRFEVTGIAVASDWFGITPREYGDKLEGQVEQLETEKGRQWAAETLAETRKRLKFSLI